MSFSPGELTAREVAQLREMLRAKEAFTRLSVSPPLNLTRAAGIPNIGIDIKSIDMTYEIQWASSFPYTISSTDVWEDTGTSLQITLPDAGTYIVFVTIYGTGQCDTPPGTILFRVYNETLSETLLETSNSSFGSTVGNYYLLNLQVADILASASGTQIIPVTVTQPTTIRVDARRTGGGTWANSQLSTSSFIGYIIP